MKIYILRFEYCFFDFVLEFLYLVNVNERCILWEADLGMLLRDFIREEVEYRNYVVFKMK